MFYFERASNENGSLKQIYLLMFESPQLLQARHDNQRMANFGGGSDLEDGGLGVGG